ncbi:hypothetical protein [Bradyrhizobium sp. SBR1B]|uniref:hypothetical protein n=1 Tax=Bradyrhizobium sp. SBR1B TaxID=2663836 RepID=UPI001605FB8B|nr:hypothetical protein [Bradyrhizobium sp. SBR1B]MBB4383213.1 hypothetical protein [Bradyrhizobium sp. SBR1B]
MDPFNSINPLYSDFAAFNAAASQAEQRQADFGSYMVDVPQLDATTAEHPILPDHSDPHLADGDHRLAGAFRLEHQRDDDPYLEQALARREDPVAWYSAPGEALGSDNEPAGRGRYQDPLREIMGEAILGSSLYPPPRHHQSPDEFVRYLNWSDGSPPAANEFAATDPSSGHGVLLGQDYTGQFRPEKRQRTLDQTEADANERQLSEPGSSVAREPMDNAVTPFQPSNPLVLPAEGYDQDLLWAMMERAAPTERHDQAPDSEVAVRSFGGGHVGQRTSAALEGSNVLPSQDSPPAPFIVHTDRFTALFVPAAAMRGSAPLNLSGAPIHFGSRPETVPQPTERSANRTSSAPLARTIEQAGPASARAETTPPAVREVYAASFAVPEGFIHGTQPAPYTMIFKLGRWGLLPDATQQIKQYDLAGERYTALLGPGGPNDVRLIHHPQM